MGRYARGCWQGTADDYVEYRSCSDKYEVRS